MSIDKGHLDIRTSTRLVSETGSNFFDDEQSIKSNMLGSLLNETYQDNSSSGQNES